MGDAEPCVEARHNGALCAGFATELLRLSRVGCGTLIHQAVRERGAVLPTMDLGAHAGIIDVGIAAFFHTEQRVAHRGLGQGQGLEPEQYFVILVICCAVHRP